MLIGANGIKPIFLVHGKIFDRAEPIEGLGIDFIGKRLLGNQRHPFTGRADFERGFMTINRKARALGVNCAGRDDQTQTTWELRYQFKMFGHVPF